MKATRYIRKLDANKEWFLVDAKDQSLGRLCTNISKILRGKHKPTYTPNTDTGDFVVVINADKIKISGNKFKTKEYLHFSGYPGGLKTTKYEILLSKKPKAIIEHAVKGMLPHNRLGRQLISKLKVYKGSEHPHKAQAPKEIKITKEKK